MTLMDKLYYVIDDAFKKINIVSDYPNSTQKGNHDPLHPTGPLTSQGAVLSQSLRCEGGKRVSPVKESVPNQGTKLVRGSEVEKQRLKVRRPGTAPLETSSS